ncbi:MAG: LarC family nickel insertion protein [Kiritimatiellae bacterium]|nr:LarC family nickel insertion protein [Kiritimatiellia bacterium]
MKTLYLQLESGAAGDMLAAALLELVPDRAAALARLAAAMPPGVELHAARTTRGGLAGTLLDVSVHGEVEGRDHPDHHDHHHHHTTLAEVRGRIEALPLPDAVRADALAVFDSIAQAESKAHGEPVDHVHFHEVGSLDALADVACVCALMAELAPDRVLASPPNAGGGTVRCAHGVLPVPAPATANLLEGLPWRGDDPAAGELLTPTGAALLRRFVAGWGPMPCLRAGRAGVGLGHREIPGRANAVRAFLGEEPSAAAGGPNGRVCELLCNIDDMTGEDLALACDRLRGEPGALDVSLSPLQMKKGRPGHLLRVLCRPEAADALAAAALRGTSTIGVRRVDCTRYEMAREIRVEGGVRVKHSAGYGAAKTKPEADDRAARR